MKIRGHIYYIFPIVYDTRKNDVDLIDCWFNRNFGWLLEGISEMMSFLGFLVGRRPWFLISFRGKELEKFKKNTKKIKKVGKN